MSRKGDTIVTLSNERFKAFCKVLSKLSPHMYDIVIDKGIICQLSDDRLLFAFIDLSQLLGKEDIASNFSCNLSNIAEKLNMMQLIGNGSDINIDIISDNISLMRISDDTSTVEFLLPDKDLMQCVTRSVESLREVLDSSDIKIATFDLSSDIMIKRFIGASNVFGCETYKIMLDSETNEASLIAESINKVNRMKIMSTEFNSSFKPILQKRIAEQSNNKGSSLSLEFTKSIGVFDSAISTILTLYYNSTKKSFILKYEAIPIKISSNDNETDNEKSDIVSCVILTTAIER